MNSTQKNKGFSLIELMVVISIIGVLMAIGAISFTTAQKKARDASRQADMKALSQGLEQYYTVNAAYPTSANCSELYATDDFVPGGAPVDPRNVSPQTYSFTCSASAFCVCANLENESGNSNDTACDYDNSGDETHFCMTNQQ